MLTVSVNGISAHVSETGEGEPVVLLHSGAGVAPTRSSCTEVTAAEFTDPSGIHPRRVRHCLIFRGEIPDAGLARAQFATPAVSRVIRASSAAFRRPSNCS